MKRVTDRSPLASVLLATVLSLVICATAVADNWTSTAYWDEASQPQYVQVTSMVPHKLTCTVTWRGTYIGPQAPGAPNGATGGTFTMVLPAYPGSGAAIVGRQGAKYITNFTYKIVCS